MRYTWMNAAANCPTCRMGKSHGPNNTRTHPHTYTWLHAQLIYKCFDIHASTYTHMKFNSLIHNTRTYWYIYIYMHLYIHTYTPGNKYTYTHRKHTQHSYLFVCKSHTAQLSDRQTDRQTYRGSCSIKPLYGSIAEI